MEHHVTHPTGNQTGTHKMPNKIVSPASRSVAAAVLAATLLTFGTAEAAPIVVFEDGFEDGVKFGAVPNTYGSQLFGVGSIVSSGALTGSNALELTSLGVPPNPIKEGVLYTLTDVFQAGTYAVSYQVKRTSGLAQNFSALTFGSLSSNQFGSVYLNTQLSGNDWVEASFSVTLTGTEAAIGNTIQLLIDQSRGQQGESDKILVDDLRITYTAPNSVPEPSTLGMMLTGLAGGGFSVWRRKRQG